VAERIQSAELTGESFEREITGTRWNGWVFFGLKNHQIRT
jgi:hypothetical protein